MWYEPKADRLLVKVVELEGEKTIGGIIVPETARERPSMGEVVAVGPGSPVDGGKVRPVDVQVGDIVVFGKFSGTTVEDDDGEELLFLRESDVIAVRRDGKPKVRVA